MIPGVRDMPGGHHQGDVEFESGEIFFVIQDGRKLIVIFKK